MKKKMRLHCIALGNWAMVSAFAGAAEVRSQIQPMSVLKQHGSFALKRETSYYKFTQDGKFYSGPTNGILGETLEGTWQLGQNENEFVVKAKRGELNQFPGPPAYRRLVFFISYLNWKPRAKVHQENILWCIYPWELYEGAFRIQEITNISQEEMNETNRHTPNASPGKGRNPTERENTKAQQKQAVSQNPPGVIRVNPATGLRELSPSPELWTRSFKVDPVSFSAMYEKVMDVKKSNPATPDRPPGSGIRTGFESDQPPPVDAIVKLFRQETGIDLCFSGRQLFYNDRLGQLVIRATKDELAKIDKFIEAINQKPATPARL